MIRFGISFDSLDSLKEFIGELICFHFVKEYKVSSSHVLIFILDCNDSFDAYTCIGKIHTILRNLRMEDRADIFTIDFCSLPD